jgi:HSP20 family protein
MPIADLAPWRWGERKLPIRREEEGDPFFALQRRMGRLFDDFASSFELAPFGEIFGAFSPRLDLSETEQELKVSAELPGLDEKNVEVSLTKNTLTISGEKKEEKEDKGQNFYRMERSYGSFKRTIPLPCEVEGDKVEATFNKGILTITLPKTEEARKHIKKITVKTE